MNITIDQILERVHAKQCEIIMKQQHYAEPKLSIYIAEDMYQKLKAQIKGECSYAAVTFHQDGVILGHPVYRVIGTDYHFRIVEG